MNDRPKKTWVKPEIVEVPLEAEEEVLAFCYTASMSSRTHEIQGCRQGRCYSN